LGFIKESHLQLQMTLLFFSSSTSGYCATRKKTKSFFMPQFHHYSLVIQWTGNKGNGTLDYRSYERSHTIAAPRKSPIEGSSDPAFRGDVTMYSPEDLFVASLSACHMLWYLHLCAEAGVIVTAYVDNARGTMVETAGRGGRFTEVTLFPEVTLAQPEMLEKATQLHKKANELCFIANSCNFPVHHRPNFKT
jgi:organic hydroperoxide reductase OsmC/OhrA